MFMVAMSHYTSVIATKTFFLLLILTLFAMHYSGIGLLPRKWTLHQWRFLFLAYSMFFYSEFVSVVVWNFVFSLGSASFV